MKYTEYLDFLKRHEEQKKLEAYQLSRVLPRPRTKKLHLVIYISIFFVAAAAIACIFLLPLALWKNALIFALAFCLFSEFYLRFLGIKSVECYQHYASEERRRKCLCIPSCSEYAILCFKKFPFIKAIFKIRKRLYKTCRGDEYKIDPLKTSTQEKVNER